MTAFGACLFDLGKHSSQTASGFQRRFLYLPPKSPFQSMVSKWLIGKVRELSCSAETQTQDSLADSCNHQTPQSPPWVCSLGTCESCCQDHHGLGRKPDLQARSGQHSSDMGKRDPGVVLELVYFISRVPCWEQNGGGVGGGFFFFSIKRCDWELAIFDDMFLPERSSPFETLMKSCGAPFSEVSKRNPTVLTYSSSTGASSSE